MSRIEDARDVAHAFRVAARTAVTTPNDSRFEQPEEAIAHRRAKTDRRRKDDREENAKFQKLITKHAPRLKIQRRS